MLKTCSRRYEFVITAIFPLGGWNHVNFDDFDTNKRPLASVQGGRPWKVIYRRHSVLSLEIWPVKTGGLSQEVAGKAGFTVPCIDI